jgi:hypothetical protein
MKQCSVCGHFKELSKDNFYPSLRELDGFHHVCRTCSSVKFKKKEEQRDKAYFSAQGNIQLKRREKKEENLLNYINGLKKCSHCDTVKPLNEFYKNSSTSDKLTSWCKQCTKERHLAYQQDNVVKEQNDNRGADRHDITA